MTASRESECSTAKVRSAQAGVSFCSAAVLFDLILHLNAMEPFDNETRHWCVQMQARIGRSWTQDETSERNSMDIGDNGENGACVYGTGEGSTEVVYVGSSAALRCPTLEDHIHIMVSFGPPDLRNLVDRPQEGWDQFLRGLCIDHFAIQLADPKTTAPGEGPLCQKMANVYLFAWRSMCVLICRSRRNCKEKVPAGLLFHCLTGNNRSSAALVAWLIFRHHMTASEGIRLLLQARPTLNPWQERPHILWALKTWEMKMEATHHFVHSMVAEEIPRLTPDLIRSALGGGLKVPLPVQVSTRLNIRMAPRLRLNHAQRQCRGKLGKWLVRVIGRREQKILLWNQCSFKLVGGLWPGLGKPFKPFTWMTRKFHRRRIMSPNMDLPMQISAKLMLFDLPIGIIDGWPALQVIAVQ